MPKSPEALNLSKEHSTDDLVPQEPPYKKVSSFLRIGIFLLSLGLFITLGINFYLNQIISYQEGEQASLLSQIKEYSATETEIKQIGKRTDFYTHYVNKRTKLKDKLSYIYESVPDGVEVKYIFLDPSEFRIFIESPSSYQMSILISNLLQTGTIKEITLESASYDFLSQIYSVQIKGNF